VLLDIYSRHLVGWMIADRESSVLAGRLIANPPSQAADSTNEDNGGEAAQDADPAERDSVSIDDLKIRSSRSTDDSAQSLRPGVSQSR